MKLFLSSLRLLPGLLPPFMFSSRSLGALLLCSLGRFGWHRHGRWREVDPRMNHTDRERHSCPFLIVFSVFFFIPRQKSDINCLKVDTSVPSCPSRCGRAAFCFVLALPACVDHNEERHIIHMAEYCVVYATYILPGALNVPTCESQRYFAPTDITRFAALLALDAHPAVLS